MKIGLPMHVVDIDWKPESGCESQSARCGKYGATMQLHIVKSKLCCQREANGAVDENEMLVPDSRATASPEVSKTRDS